MMNNLTLVGRWTKDLELKYTPSGTAVATGILAVQRDRKNPQTDEYEADFPQIVLWGKTAEHIANYSGKGLLTGITGRIQTRRYEGQDGKMVYVTEVVSEKAKIIEWKDNGQGGQQSSGNQNRNQNQNQGRSGGNPPGGWNDDPFANDGKPIEISDDDLPF